MAALFQGEGLWEEVWKAIKRKHFPPKIADDIRRTWKSILVPMPGTIGLIRRLKPTYSVFFISNVDRDSAGYVWKKYPGIFRLFDGGGHVIPDRDGKT